MQRRLSTAIALVLAAVWVAAGPSDWAKQSSGDESQQGPQQGPPGKRMAPHSDPNQARILYAIGADFAKSFPLLPEEIDTVVRGMRDAAAGRPLEAEPEPLRGRIDMIRKIRGKTKEREAIDKYAAEPGAQRTPNGTIYRVLRPGTGPRPQAADRVRLHYHGTLHNGQIFDSTVQRNAPHEVVLNKAIACWYEGLQRMQVGEKARLICPPHAAYGDEGRPPLIPERAMLFFDVELLAIVK